MYLTLLGKGTPTHLEDRPTRWGAKTSPANEAVWVAGLRQCGGPELSTVVCGCEAGWMPNSL
jgi:hypothetical protein